MRVRRWVSLGVAVVVASILMAGTSWAPNKKVDVIRGYGSETTYDVMLNLDRYFNLTPANGTEGCFVVTQDTANTSQPDLGCNPATAGPPFSAENWDHDVGVSYFPGGSGNGVNQLLHQGEPGYAKIDYARSSSGRGTNPAQLKFVAFARDALPWVNWRDETGSPAAGVSDLTKTQLQDIFINCTIDKWSQIGGSHAGQADDDILIWAAQAGSGTRKTFDSSSFLGGNSATCLSSDKTPDGLDHTSDRVIFEHDPTPIRICDQDPDGGGPLQANCPANGWKQSIWYMGFAAHVTAPVHPQYGKAMGADMGAIGGIAPTSETISGEGTGFFLFARYVYNVYRASFGVNDATPATIDYIGEKGWICKGTAGAPDNVVAGTDSDSRGGHIVRKQTGTNWADEITKAINEMGMARLPYGPINRKGVNATGSSRCFLV